MATHKHELTRGTRHTPGEFGTLFDWLPVEEEAAPPDDEGAVERLRAACLGHLEGGGVLVRSTFGVRLANCRREDRGPSVPPGPLRAEYATSKYADPFGALLAGAAFGSGVLPDAARALGVDEYWVVGFLHGVDRTPPFMAGKRFADLDESPSYRAGRAAGLEIADEFIHVTGGWEVEGAA